MIKRLLTLSVALGLAMAMAMPAGAVDLMENQAGAISCEDGFEELHFVHNKIRGTADDGVIVITFGDGDGGMEVVEAVSTFSNRGTVHYTVSVDPDFEILLNASDDIRIGMLVLSDAKCKKGDPKGL